MGHRESEKVVKRDDDHVEHHRHGRHQHRQAWLRMQAAGCTIRYEIWVDGTSEPAAWEVSLTDTSVSAAGQLHLSLVPIGVFDRSTALDDLQWRIP